MEKYGKMENEESNEELKETPGMRDFGEDQECDADLEEPAGYNLPKTMLKKEKKILEKFITEASLVSLGRGP